MKRLLTEPELEKISAHIAAGMGLNFPPSNWRNLEQNLRTAARELGFTDVQECIARFTSAPPSQEFIASLAPYLTIGETYFLREISCFEILEKQVIPEIIKNRQGKEQRLRIWSAGCATGEEAYSLAILLDKMAETLRGWKISILATDINPLVLNKAREGVYTNWSFRKTPPDFRENYFRRTEDGRFALIPKIKEMVTFSSLNLISDSYSSLGADTNAMDVIFCRNVLMYFTPQLAGKVVEQYRRCLLDGGSLFVSSCETSSPFFIGFAPVHSPGATFYQKKGKGRTETTAAPPPPLPEIPHPTSAYQEALTLYTQGAYKEAAERVFFQLARNKNDPRALTLLCRIYADQGRLSEALTFSSQALAIDMLSAELHYLRAVILQEQGLDDESAASFKKALYLEQDLVLAHFALAKLEQRKGKNRESRIHFSNALSLLGRYRPDDVIPESDGMVAGQLKEIIRTTTARM